MESFLEILKYTIPGLIVFATAYFLLKMFLDDRQLLFQQQMRAEGMKTTLPIRLQAYERLSLLCERASLQNTLLRIRMPEMTVSTLRASLMLAISQEFEHNLSQQVYVSNTLWQIITLAKDETLAVISQAAEGLDPKDSDERLVEKLLYVVDLQGANDPLHRALIAIRTEAGQLF
ncbi:MAG: hypothetical protein KGS48_03775 [Bacteroidetes bacterium]|nr:hypothetical protein [Bacteroidota bacterium]